jgi:hypothetical protein
MTTPVTPMEAIAIYRRALEDICNPIAAMQRDLEEGCTLNGAMAISICANPEHYMGIAAKALAATAQVEAPAGEPVGEVIGWTADAMGYRNSVSWTAHRLPVGTLLYATPQALPATEMAMPATVEAPFSEPVAAADLVPWKLAPVVATQAMLDAGRASLAAGNVPMAKLYHTMVDAAPSIASLSWLPIIGWYKDKKVDANEDSQNGPAKWFTRRAIVASATAPDSEGWKALVELADVQTILAALPAAPAKPDASAPAAPTDAKPLPEQKESGAVYGIIDPDYGRIYTMVRKLAWEEGYAIGLHGSFTRDLDMIAVPWEAGRRCNPEKLVARILQATGLKEAHGNPGIKPHGRLVWTLLLPEFGDPRFVDLSIMPAPKAEAAPTDANAPAAAVSVNDAALREAIAESLRGLYYCNRVWSAWSVGTMSQDDFYPAEDQTESIDEVFYAVKEVIAAGKKVAGAAHDVLLERRRQIEKEGWTPAHDDEHPSEEIAAFAALYALPPAARDWPAESTGYGDTFGEAICPEGWTPKFGDRRHELVRAGALILAEIERLDRAARADAMLAERKKGGA